MCLIPDSIFVVSENMPLFLARQYFTMRNETLGGVTLGPVLKLQIMIIKGQGWTADEFCAWSTLERNRD